MKEVFVLERMVLPGVWELLSNSFYADEKTALDDCLGIMRYMQKEDKNFTARVTKLSTALTD